MYMYYVYTIVNGIRRKGGGSYVTAQAFLDCVGSEMALSIDSSSFS